MPAFLPTCAAVLSCALILSGCNDRTSDYPDHSPETTRQVDNVKRTAQDKKNAIDQEYAEKANLLDFRERQIREKYNAEREESSLNTDQELTKLNARRQQLELRKSAPGNDVDRDDVNDGDGNVEQDLADVRKKIDELERKARTEKERLDRDEQRELIELEKERNQAHEAMREKKLEVDRWMTKELDSINTEADRDDKND